MAPISLSISLIPLFLLSFSLLPNPTIAAHFQSSGPPAHISKACEGSPNKDLCVHVLTSAPAVRTTPADDKKPDMKGLVFIALQASLKNASDTSIAIKFWLNDTVEEPEIDDDLVNCQKVYGDVTDQIEEAVNALVSGAYDDVAKMMSLAIADIETCDNQVRGGPSHAGELAEKCETLKSLCEVSMGILGNLKDT